MDEFSKRLKDLMEMEGLSNRALSMKINVDRASIRLWLSGRFYSRYDALIKLAAFFNVSIDYLIGLENVTDNNVRKAVSMEEVRKHFFLTLSRYMEENHLTIYAMAKRIDIDQKAFTNWLTKGSMPETGMIIRLAKEMKIFVDDLLGWEVKDEG